LRLKIHDQLDNMRVQLERFPMTYAGDLHGLFMTGDHKQFPGLKIISSGITESDWEHVSVSRTDRCPTWEEMCFVKELFWSGSETVVQFHPRKSEYVNTHPYCLHMWKKCGVEYELPPNVAV